MHTNTNTNTNTIAVAATNSRDAASDQPLAGVTARSGQRPDDPATPAAAALPLGPRFRTILADPPWDLGQKGRLGAAAHYNLMTLERIKAMPVAELAENDAHLYLWVINGAIREGLDVMAAWGFTYRSTLTWIKPRFGLGNYLRNQTEHLLLGTRGKAPVKFRGQGTWMYAPLQDHSHKPEEQYAVIERLSDGPYLELFARRRQPGWHSWGNEMVDSDIVIPGYPVPSDARHRRQAAALHLTPPDQRAADTSERPEARP